MFIGIFFRRMMLSCGGIFTYPIVFQIFYSWLMQRVCAWWNEE